MKKYKILGAILWFVGFIIYCIAISLLRPIGTEAVLYGLLAGIGATILECGIILALHK